MAQVSQRWGLSTVSCSNSPSVNPLARKNGRMYRGICANPEPPQAACWIFVHTSCEISTRSPKPAVNSSRTARTRCWSDGGGDQYTSGPCSSLVSSLDQLAPNMSYST